MSDKFRYTVTPLARLVNQNSVNQGQELSSDINYSNDSKELDIPERVIFGPDSETGLYFPSRNFKDESNVLN